MKYCHSRFFPNWFISTQRCKCPCHFFNFISMTSHPRMNETDDSKLSFLHPVYVTGWLLFSVTVLKYFMNTNFSLRKTGVLWVLRFQWPWKRLRNSKFVVSSSKLVIYQSWSTKLLTRLIHRRFFQTMLNLEIKKRKLKKGTEI